MMSDRLAAAYNDQITLELSSSHAYLQLAAYFADTSLTGFESSHGLQQWPIEQLLVQSAHLTLMPLLLLGQFRHWIGTQPDRAC